MVVEGLHTGYNDIIIFITIYLGWLGRERLWSWGSEDLNQPTHVSGIGTNSVGEIFRQLMALSKPI